MSPSPKERALSYMLAGPKRTQFLSRLNNTLDNRILKMALESDDLLLSSVEKIAQTPELRFQNDGEAQKRLEQARQWQAEGKTVVYYNLLHTHELDLPFDYYRLIVPYLLPPDHEPEQCLQLISFKFNPELFEEVASREEDGMILETLADGTQSPVKPMTALACRTINLMAEHLGYTNVFVVQKYIREKILRSQEAKNFAQNDINHPQLALVQELTDTEGGLVAIYASGTRDKTGSLARAERDIVAFASSADTLIFPITNSGIHRMQDRDRVGLDGLNPHVVVTTRVGKPILAQEAYQRANNYRWASKIIENLGWTNKEARFHAGDYIMQREAAELMDTLEKRVAGVNPLGIYHPDNIIKAMEQEILY